jgi:hypothetical protein
MELAVTRLRLKNKLRQRRAVDGFDFCPLPIVTQISIPSGARRRFEHWLGTHGPPSG